jgi:hypothetical protein
MRSSTALYLGLFTLFATVSSADSELGPCSLNGINLFADVEVGYDGVGSTLANDFASASDSVGPLVAAGSTSGNASANAVKVPAAGLAKDLVDGELKAAFEFGTPFGSIAQDTLVLEAFGDGSAENSTNAVGNDSDAVVTGEARAEFFIDHVAGVDCDTVLTLPAVRNLLPYEVLLEINIIRDPSGTPVVLTLGPGSPPQNVFLPEGFAYVIQLNYDYRVPFGIDPPFFFSFPMKIGATPTPSLGMEGTIVVVLLLMFGGAVFQARRAKA